MKILFASFASFPTPRPEAAVRDGRAEQQRKKSRDRRPAGAGVAPLPSSSPPLVSSGRRGDTAAVAATSGVSGSFLFALNSVRRGARSSRAEVAARSRWAEDEGGGRSCAARFGWARAEAAA